jgi:hypothetical protein
VHHAGERQRPCIRDRRPRVEAQISDDDDLHRDDTRASCRRS